MDPALAFSQGKPDRRPSPLFCQAWKLPRATSPAIATGSHGQSVRHTPLVQTILFPLLGLYKLARYKCRAHWDSSVPISKKNAGEWGHRGSPVSQNAPPQGGARWLERRYGAATEVWSPTEMSSVWLTLTCLLRSLLY